MSRATVGFHLAVLLSTGIPFLQAEASAKGQVYVKHGESWFVEENGKLYRMLPNQISIKFKPATTDEQIHRFVEEHALEIGGVNRLGIYEMEVTIADAFFATLDGAKRSALVEYAEANTMGEYVVEESPAQEMIIRSQRFVRQGDKWYLDANGTSYEVIPNSLSCKFERDTTREQRQEFLETNGFKVIRQNRLGIYDVEIPPGKGVLQSLAELQDHPWLEYVEVNTLGTYEIK